MKNYQFENKNHFIPIGMMVVFTVVLFVFLVARVYQSDRDLANVRIGGVQSLLAAEAGIHLAKTVFQKFLNQIEGGNSSAISNIFENAMREIHSKIWKKIGANSDSFFRIRDSGKIPMLDQIDSWGLDESEIYYVSSEGKFQNNFSKAVGVIYVLELVKNFAVVNSLNEYYYGQPIQALASVSGGIDNFIAANSELFEKGKISSRGICGDPKLLVQVFQPGSADPFKTPPNIISKGNFGSQSYFRSGESPCEGPLYCYYPIVVDSHNFFNPVQTAFFFFRRGEERPKIQMEHSTVPLISSRRVQLALDKLEGEMPSGVLFDQDSTPKTAFVPSWRPNFSFLRQLAKRNGIYIDADGNGFNKGTPNGIDYHKGNHKVISEGYLLPVANDYQRDCLDENFIVLSTKTKFEGKNNLDYLSLKGSKILFSENSIYLRGQIGGDLVVVTPKHIFLTGSTNDEGNFHLFLIAGEGVALDTNDLEYFCDTKKPETYVLEMARNWVIRAVIYKPGAGWFCNWPMGSENDNRVFPAGDKPAQRISLTIYGACIEGNLNRWIPFAGPSGIKVKWDRNATDRLPVVPRVANILRIKSSPENF